MAKPKDLVADDVGDYSVSDPGWYAVDDGGKVVLGPFDSLSLCERAIRDWRRTGKIESKVPR